VPPGQSLGPIHTAGSPGLLAPPIPGITHRDDPAVENRDAACHVLAGPEDVRGALLLPVTPVRRCPQTNDTRARTKQRRSASGGCRWSSVSPRAKSRTPAYAAPVTR
jgi:hypothetical protein